MRDRLLRVVFFLSDGQATSTRQSRREQREEGQAGGQACAGGSDVRVLGRTHAAAGIASPRIASNLAPVARFVDSWVTPRAARPINFAVSRQAELNKVQAELDAEIMKLEVNVRIEPLHSRPTRVFDAHFPVHCARPASALHEVADTALQFEARKAPLLQARDKVSRCRAMPSQSSFGDYSWQLGCGCGLTCGCDLAYCEMGQVSGSRRCSHAHLHRDSARPCHIRTGNTALSIALVHRPFKSPSSTLPQPAELPRGRPSCCAPFAGQGMPRLMCNCECLGISTVCAQPRAHGRLEPSRQHARRTAARGNACRGTF